jgi:hypothetical protein
MQLWRIWSYKARMGRTYRERRVAGRGDSVMTMFLVEVFSLYLFIMFSTNDSLVPMSQFSLYRGYFDPLLLLQVSY